MEHEKSERNERIEEEQTSNSQDRENLEKEWKKKLEKEKCEHDLELKQLKEGFTRRLEQEKSKLNKTSMRYSYPPPWHILLSTYYSGKKF